MMNHTRKVIPGVGRVAFFACPDNFRSLIGPGCLSGPVYEDHKKLFGFRHPCFILSANILESPAIADFQEECSNSVLMKVANFRRLDKGKPGKSKTDQKCNSEFVHGPNAGNDCEDLI